jgi:hypothetical protein
MCQLISEQALRKRMGEAGRRFVTECFSMEKYCGSIQRIILEHVQNGSTNH